jgi:hypothetical protein
MLKNDKDQGFAAFPTYPVVLMLKGTSRRSLFAGFGCTNDMTGASSDVTDFSKMVGSDRAPGLPAFDPNRAVS